jgi:hypothetical protein
MVSGVESRRSGKPIFVIPSAAACASQSNGMAAYWRDDIGAWCQILGHEKIVEMETNTKLRNPATKYSLVEALRRVDS